MRRLLQHRSQRHAERAFVIEGSKLLSAALDAGASVEVVYASAAGMADSAVGRARELAVPVVRLADGVVERVADAVTPQPVLAVVEAVDVPLADLRRGSYLVVSADVRDPGNLGTLIRVAEGAGADGVVCCAGSVDPYNPKAVRASAGALFGVPLVAGGPPAEVLDQLGGWGLRRLGTRPASTRPAIAGSATPAGGLRYDQADLTGAIALVFGNESHGLDSRLDPVVDGHLVIPMEGRTGSLNVAAAAAVICFESARQRRARS